MSVEDTEKTESQMVERMGCVVTMWHETVEEYKLYRKTGLQLMRPYIPGEDLIGISVSPEDTPEVGGMIAVNSQNHDDRWYVAKDFFNKNYEMVHDQDI